MQIGWNELKEKFCRFDSVYKEPVETTKQSNSIPDCPLAGGGKLALSMDSSYSDVTYYVTKTDFWTPALYPEWRFPKFAMKPTPFANIRINIDNCAQENSAYSHEQKMENATIKSAFSCLGGQLEVSACSPAQTDYVIIELLSRNADAELTVDIETENHNNNYFILDGADDGIIWAVKEHKSFITVNSAIAGKIYGAENIRFNYKKRIAPSVSFTVLKDTPAFMVFNVNGGKDIFNHKETAINSIKSFTPETKERLLNKNDCWWKNYWLKSSIDIGCPDIEKYYYGALYVLGTTIDIEGRTPPGLAGGWINNPDPIWGGNYTMNYNGEAPFWPLFSSNRANQAMPYIRMVCDFVPTAEILAKEMNTKGIIFPVMIEPFGISDNCDPLYQKSNASLAGISLIWYFDYTLDKECLIEYIYPYLLKCLDFWEDNLILENGRYTIQNSAQRERVPGDMNAGSELAYARIILTAMVKYSDLLNKDNERREKWQDYLNRLSEYPVMVFDNRLVFKECENRRDLSLYGIGDNPCNLDHVYPSEALDMDERADYRYIARNTLKVMDSWYQSNAFPRVFSQAVRAKYNPKEILHHFRTRLKMDKYPNEIVRKNCTFIPHDHGFEGVGGVEFINSMLASAHNGIIQIFPLWDKETDAKFDSIRVKGAFLISAKIRSGKISDISIYSEKGGKCKLLSPFGVGISVLQNGNPVECEYIDGLFVFNSKAGETYNIIENEKINICKDEKLFPLALVADINTEARAKPNRCQAAVDIILDNTISSAKLSVDMVMSDESITNKYDDLAFNSIDENIAGVDSSGKITAESCGITDIVFTASKYQKKLSGKITVQVIKKNIITDIIAASSIPRKFDPYALCVESAVNGYGMTGGDLCDKSRMNPYGYGMYADFADGNERILTFDFRKEYKLDEMWLWNFNCPDDNYRKLWWIGGTISGIKHVKIEYSKDEKEWIELKTEGYPFEFAKADGQNFISAANLTLPGNPPVKFCGVNAQYVRFIISGTVGECNWGGERCGFNQVRFTYGS